MKDVKIEASESDEEPTMLQQEILMLQSHISLVPLKIHTLTAIGVGLLFFVSFANEVKKKYLIFCTKKLRFLKF